MATFDYWPDVADAYRKLGKPWPGVQHAERKLLCDALTRVEDEYELSRSQPKQAVRSEIKLYRRALEAQAWP